MPIHRVMRMLQQIRRVLQDQAIGVQRRAIGMKVFGARPVFSALSRQRSLQLLLQGSRLEHIRRIIRIRR